MPKLAPFFLPTVANETGFTFKQSLEAEMNSESKKGGKTANLFLSDFATKLEKSSRMEECKRTLNKNLKYRVIF